MSINHMMAADYYGTPSYGYDTFVTMSSKRSVATQFLVMDASRAAQIFGRRIMVIVHFGLWASGESAMERYPKRTGPSGPLAALAGPLYLATAIIRWCVPRIVGGQLHGTIERRPNRHGTGK
jgi:hypothetical protein